MIFALIILFFIILMIIGICFSSIVINIDKLNCNSNNVKKVLTEKIEFYIQIYFFKIFKIITIKVYNTHLEFLGIKIKFDKLIYEFEDTNRLFSKIKDFVSLIKNNRQSVDLENLKPNIKEFKMNLEISTENAILTSITTVSISTILSIILKKYVEKYNKEKHYYKIIPRFVNVNSFYISLNTKISFDTLKLLIFGYEVRKLIKQNTVIQEQENGISRILDKNIEKLKIINRLGKINKKSKQESKNNFFA